MQFTVMPFGFRSASAAFQRLIDSIITPELEPRAFCYLGDIIIVTSSFDEHVRITKPFVLQTDASNDELDAMLTQPHDDKEWVIAYASRSLSSAERNYSATEKECLAVKWGIWKMRDYLEGYHFTVLADHQSLKWLEKIDSPSGRLARWAIELGQWDYEIRYRLGAENHVADALSCQPLSVCMVDTKDSGKWYRDTLGVQSNPRSFPEHSSHEGRLFRHLLHTIYFNEHSESEAWKLCVPAVERQ